MAIDIREIFENRIKIETFVISIDSLFGNEEKVRRTNYKPYYQRNYVWDDEKATYFIESILLGTEIPPLVYYRDGEDIEVIDGRQRYETIYRFINNDFKLKKNGLQKLDIPDIANKAFKDFKDKFRELFWDTKIRIIEFSFHTPALKNDEIEEAVKKEIFTRYNSGITPLKPMEIDKAAYNEDSLNSYFKEKLKDKVLYGDISSIFHFENSNEEKILKKIRQLLVQHQIPVKYFAVKKDNIITKYYELLSSNLEEKSIELIYSSFITKVNLLKKIRKKFDQNKVSYNRLISESLFWALSILETEEKVTTSFNEIKIEDLTTYLFDNLEAYSMDRSSFYTELNNRYKITSEYFKNRFEVSFDIYLNTSQDFLAKTKSINVSKDAVSFENLRINKPEPSVTAIVDITRMMGRQRFLIRPAYQRSEVINKKKSSMIIESILLGIKLPPIFIYKRADEVSEVLDGQQRLLSILGFTGRKYLDENHQETPSNKHEFKLQLKTGILHHLHGKGFKDLTPAQQNKILNYNLWIIEINHSNNADFEPIDLFIRLNSKPYPIKDDTFEMWNSYISRDIILTIKAVYKGNRDWFYIRKSNSRMENENIYTALAFLQYNWAKKGSPSLYDPDELGIYKVFRKVYYRVKSKNDITRLLENSDSKREFIEAINDLEFEFISKLKVLLSDDQIQSSAVLNRNLDEILGAEKGKRTQQSLYALWHFLVDIPNSVVSKYTFEIRNDLKLLFQEVADSKDWPVMLTEFKARYAKGTSTREKRIFIDLGTIMDISAGIQADTLPRKSIFVNYPYLGKSADFKHLTYSQQDIGFIEEDMMPPGQRHVFDAKTKILIKKNLVPGGRLQLAIVDESLAYSNDILGLIPNRAGFLPKYIAAIVYSTYTIRTIIEASNSKDDLKAITLNDLRNVSVPVLPISEQHNFSLIIDYLIQLKDSRNAALFFERLLDALVFEAFLKDIFESAGVSIGAYVYDIRLNSAEVTKIEDAEYAYRTLSATDHPISGNLAKLLTVSEMQNYDSHIL